jgi:hypothetical protein
MKLQQRRGVGAVSKPPKEITTEEFKFACDCLQDCQRYIAAGKVQRWEVMKWAVSVNLILTTAALATSASKWAMFIFCVFVSGVSIYLLHHYNWRMTKVRSRVQSIVDLLYIDHPNIKKFDGDEPYSTDLEKLKEHDKQEMTLFFWVIALSAIPAFCVWAFNAGQLMLGRA